MIEFVKNRLLIYGCLVCLFGLLKHIDIGSAEQDLLNFIPAVKITKEAS